MSKHKETSALIDAILYTTTGGLFIASSLLLPGSAIALEKPALKILDKLDERSKKRRIQQTLRYMKTKGLVRGDYQHGIEITKKGERRLANLKISNLQIDTSGKWDKSWRLVLFDIPESKRESRRIFTSHIKMLGFQLLQLSVWVHPYECKEEIALLCKEYDISDWVTYIVTNHIDHEEDLKKRFSKIM